VGLTTEEFGDGQVSCRGGSDMKEGTGREGKAEAVAREAGPNLWARKENVRGEILKRENVGGWGRWVLGRRKRERRGRGA